MSKKMKNLPESLSIQIIVNGEMYNVNKIAGFKLEDKRTLTGNKLTSHVSIELVAEASREEVDVGNKPSTMPLISCPEDRSLPAVRNIMPAPKMAPPKLKYYRRKGRVMETNESITRRIGCKARFKSKTVSTVEGNLVETREYAIEYQPEKELVIIKWRDFVDYKKAKGTSDKWKEFTTIEHITTAGLKSFADMFKAIVEHVELSEQYEKQKENK